MDLLRAFLPGSLRVNANPFQTDLCRYPDYREVSCESHPWLLGSGNPCRNDETPDIFRIGGRFLIIRRLFGNAFFIPNTGTDCGFCPPLLLGEGRGEGFQKNANRDRSQYISRMTAQLSSSVTHRLSPPWVSHRIRNRQC